MSRTEAQSFVSAVWNGMRRPDAYFQTALATLGIKPEQFATLKREASKTERRFGGFLILTPTGAGRNR